MYISQTKSKNGILIVDNENRWFVSWEDLQSLKEDKILTKDGKPILIVKEFQN